MKATLVILHGWGSHVSRWRPLAGALSAAVRVLLPPLPEDKVRNTADFADWLYQQTRSLRSFYLLGHSFGGQIAINFCARYPGRVKKLILVASAGVRRRSLKALILRPWAKLFKFLPAPLKHFGYRLVGETDYFKASPVMKKTMKQILKEDQQAAMTKIAVPALILWGRFDRYTPPADGELTHRLIKNSQLAEFNAKHSLPFTHPAQVAQKILWFIGSE